MRDSMIGAKLAPSPEHVIPAKAGIQAGWGGGNLAGAPPRRPWIPAFQAVSKLPPLPLGEGWGESHTHGPGRHRPPLPPGEGWGEGHTHGPGRHRPPLPPGEPRGKQAGVNGNEWERQGYWGPSPGLRPPSPRGRGVGMRGRVAPAFGHPLPEGEGGFGTGRTGLRPPSPRGRGVRFGTGRTGLRPPSPRGRGVLTRPLSRE